MVRPTRPSLHHHWKLLRPKEGSLGPPKATGEAGRALDPSFKANHTGTQAHPHQWQRSQRVSSQELAQEQMSFYSFTISSHQISDNVQIHRLILLLWCSFSRSGPKKCLAMNSHMGTNVSDAYFTAYAIRRVIGQVIEGSLHMLRVVMYFHLLPPSLIQIPPSLPPSYRSLPPPPTHPNLYYSSGPGPKSP